MTSPDGTSSQITSAKQKIAVRFATNRDQTGGDELFGSAFRSVPPLFVTGSIDVYHKGGNPIPNWVPDPKSLHVDPIPKAATSSIPEAVKAAPSTADAMTRFVDEVRAKKATSPGDGRNSGIVFLHGFNCSFISAMGSSAQIAAAYGASHVFCFSWPSQGEFGLNPYLTDEKSAYASGDAIALTLSVIFSKVFSLPETQRPNLRIVCHSMGNRALGAAIQYISVSAPELITKKLF